MPCIILYEKQRRGGRNMRNVRKIRRKRRMLFRKFILLITLSILSFKSYSFYYTNHYMMENKDLLRERIYSFLKVKQNREKVYLNSIKLNNGESANTCVYFVSEVLRENGYKVPKNMANISNFLDFLEERNWKKNFDYKKLKPGDICFTTDESGNKYGIPTHTYIFMGWVNDGKYDYAYICDNQAKDYQNKIYHIRNINCTDTVNGFKKDAFSFFIE